MKNFLFGLALIFAFLTSFQSKAAVGALVANPIVMYTGLAITGAAGVGIVADLNAEGPLAGLGALFLVPFATLGLIILDGEEGQTIQFRELSEKSARKLGVSSVERGIYNSEIDQANSVAQEVALHLSSMESPSVEDSAKSWLSMKDAVSPLTFKVMQIVTAELVYY